MSHALFAISCSSSSLSDIMANSAWTRLSLVSPRECSRARDARASSRLPLIINQLT